MTDFFISIYRLFKTFFTKRIFSIFNSFEDVRYLFFFSVKSFFKREEKGSSIINKIIKNQIYFTGVQSFFLVSVVSLMLGAVVVVQSVTQLSKINAEAYIGKILLLVIVRELGPIFTALIVIGRSASAIATEIGNMSIAKEIEALDSLGVDPLRYILIPRLWGVTVSLVLLTVYFNVIGISGGFLAAKLTLSSSFSVLFNNLMNTITSIDVVVAFLKSLGFGIIIAIISVYEGFKVRISLTEVPQAATKAVVNSLLYSFFFNSILTVLFYI
ncbi:MAG: hypothetical protein A2474_05930 [Elusimicrobia bacterium RIFOXYC2_FULL_34_12]|nr:MAG: hypothetical protein A2474_05930 [Elusimicrobia bacterium RIFOXYC2_FULL_34_12]OGS38747.1 MAG: hypothetical protein A2551_00925 [Elusimicrobia bacterium RIFOXYD2_FULL_34_30]HAM38970.1 ABC transporter permease [Elusimicrobiota bacterium]